MLYSVTSQVANQQVFSLLQLSCTAAVLPVAEARVKIKKFRHIFSGRVLNTFLQNFSEFKCFAKHFPAKF